MPKSRDHIDEKGLNTHLKADNKCSSVILICD